MDFDGSLGFPGEGPAWLELFSEDVRRGLDRAAGVLPRVWIWKLDENDYSEVVVCSVGIGSQGEVGGMMLCYPADVFAYEDDDTDVQLVASGLACDEGTAAVRYRTVDGNVVASALIESVPRDCGCYFFDAGEGTVAAEPSVLQAAAPRLTGDFTLVVQGGASISVSLGDGELLSDNYVSAVESADDASGGDIAALLAEPGDAGQQLVGRGGPGRGRRGRGAGGAGRAQAGDSVGAGASRGGAGARGARAGGSTSNAALLQAIQTLTTQVTLGHTELASRISSLEAERPRGRGPGQGVLVAEGPAGAAAGAHGSAAARSASGSPAGGGVSLLTGEFLGPPGAHAAGVVGQGPGRGQEVGRAALASALRDARSLMSPGSATPVTGGAQRQAAAAGQAGRLAEAGVRMGVGVERRADQRVEAAAGRQREATDREVQLAILEALERLDGARAKASAAAPETLDELLYGVPGVSGDRSGPGAEFNVSGGFGGRARGAADFARLNAAIEREPKKWIAHVNSAMERRLGADTSMLPWDAAEYG